MHGVQEYGCFSITKQQQILQMTQTHGLIHLLLTINICDWACENRSCGHKLHPSDYRSYRSTGTEYLHSVTCIIPPMKCLLSTENCIAIAQWYKKVWVMEVLKNRQKSCAHVPYFCRPSHIYIYRFSGHLLSSLLL